tara:strand:+ start:86 stop:1789 length:1704 start_codon:yes stop_codon:yes gene_type:complete
MKDQILKSYVEDFRSEIGYTELTEDQCFERYVNYCLVSKQYPRDFDIESLSPGGSNDIGVDGAAIIVNGNIIQAPEEVDFLVEKNGFIDVRFMFIQSKNSTKFKGDQVGTLIFGLKSFFSDEPSIPENEEIKTLREIKDRIYKNTIHLESPPELDIYFVTTGEWKQPEPIVGRVKLELKTFEESRLFSEIKFNFYDADKLKDTYREIRRKTVKEISFSNHVALPDILKIRQSFVGSIPAKEFVRLITDSSGELQKNLFEDNIRDFQGRNKVNIGISDTLKNDELQSALSVLNNGITVIAKKVEPIGGKMKLTDFQIVNGCQSSHVLFDNKELLQDNTHIVLKVIETTDQELSHKVIQATNKQTLVTDEAFESLSSFHRDLEEYYKARASGLNAPVYYERRSKQYEGVPSIHTNQVISLTAQIKAYVATILAQPHSTHRYYGELLDANRNKMFREHDKKEPYFIACLGVNRLERAFKRGLINSKYRNFKYQILYIAHCYHEVLRKSKPGYGYEEIIESYSTIDTCLPIFNAACTTIDTQSKNSKIPWRDAVRSRDFTDVLRKNLQKLM